MQPTLTLSKLIKALQEALDQHGDLPVDATGDGEKYFPVAGVSICMEDGSDTVANSVTICDYETLEAFRG